MTDIELIVFDCDGVLIESEILGNRMEVEALNRRGCSVTLPEYIEATLGKSYEEIDRIVREQWQCTLPETFWEEVERELKEVFDRELEAVAGIHQVLEELPHPKCVASSSSYERLQHTLTLTRLWDHFHPHVFHCGCVKRGKPYPDLFLHAAKSVGVDPRCCLVVEDSEAGVLAAVAAGMRVFAFQGAKHIPYAPTINSTSLGADAIFTEMTELPHLCS